MRGQLDWQYVAGIILGAIAVLTIFGAYSAGMGGDISSYMNYTFNDVAEDTNASVDSTTNATHNLLAEQGSMIENEDDGTYLEVTVDNPNATANATITAYLNGDSLGTFQAVKDSITTHQFTDVINKIADNNTIIVESDLATPTQTLDKTNLHYNGGMENVKGDIVSSVLISAVLVLGIIIGIVGSIMSRLGLKGMK